MTFTATVTAGAGTNTPSGTVTLKEGGATIGTGTLSGSGGVATVTFSTTTLAVGTHDNITAVYGGDSNFTGSTSSSISQTVNARPLTITASSRSKTYGDTVTFAGTEFTTSGLVNSDTVTSVTLTSTGAGASAAVAASLLHRPQRRGRHRPGQLQHHLCQRHPDRQRQGPDRHRQ